MTLGTAASIIAASICLAGLPRAGWTAECTGGRCSCYGDADCTALFESGQCVAGTDVKSATEMASLCSLEARQIVLGSCQQAPSLRNVVISTDESKRLVFPHLSKDCGG